MGGTVASVKIENLTNQNARIRCDALVDNGASYMVLPEAWRDRLGELMGSLPFHSRLRHRRLLKARFADLSESKLRDLGLFTMKSCLLI